MFLSVEPSFAAYGDKSDSFGSRERRVSNGDQRQSSGMLSNNNEDNRRSENLQSTRRDCLTSRDQYSISGMSPQYSRTSVDRRERVLNRLNGSRSDRPSHDDRRGLDRDNPGDWAIKHHLNSLITRLKPEPSSGVSIPGKLGTKIREMQHRKPDSARQPTPTSSGDNMRFRTSFAEVQRMRIRKLQCQLVRHVKMRLDGNESPGWEQTLEQYSVWFSPPSASDTRTSGLRVSSMFPRWSGTH
ncbi:hypothetical protein LZ31DRAFT_548230 [Colletotrichum somersetense]|nr:hypothetical protein LZ31DRAFT_548230 [Colletotrichum somersetense]